MGNRTSTASSPSAESGGDESGVYITQSLQEKINKDFQSELLNSEWNKYRSLAITRHNDRQFTEKARELEIQEKTKAFRAQADIVHNKLDEAIDKARSTLSDLEVEVGYDVNRLSQKFEGDLPSPEGQCLETRAELSRCYNTLKDSNACQIFAQKLEKCVTESLASK